MIKTYIYLAIHIERCPKTAVFFVISYIVTKPDTWKEVSKKIFQLFRKKRRKYKMMKSIRFFMQDIGGQMMRSVHIEEFESYADLEDYLKTVKSDDEMVKLHS